MSRQRVARLGVFTFERFGTGGTGTMNKPNREIDLAEVLRFGWPANDPSCPSQANPPQLCRGGAQFTLQNWWEDPNNVHRCSIGNSAGTITLVMTRPGRR